MDPIEVSREIAAPVDEVFAHFVDPSEELRLDLHAEHVKGYKELDRGEDHLSYEFVFQSYGFRFWGKAREEFERPSKTRIFVTEGPMQDGVIDLFFEPVEGGGTRVRQVTHLPERAEGPLGRILGRRMRERITALTAVHLDQHGRDIEGLEPKRYLTPGEARAVVVMDFLRITRAVSLPIILMPLIAGAALAARDGAFEGWRLLLTLVGGALALFAGNLANDIWDFQGGADHAAIGEEGARLTGSGALLFGQLTPKGAWLVTGALFALATACGAALTLTARPWAPLFALAGLAAALCYQAPPLKLSYRGYGLGELCILIAFGPVPVAAAYYVQAGIVSPAAWALGGAAGLGAALVLYCHHFLHWRADRQAEKWSPIALLGAERGARLGRYLALAFALLLAASPWYLGAPLWAALSGLLPLALIPLFGRIARHGAEEGRAWQLLRSAGAAFTLALALVSWAL